MNDIFFKVINLYERNEKFNPLLFFFGGFTWDSLTLKRIDRLFDNLLLLLYLLLLGLLIILMNLVENEKIESKIFLRYRKWYPLAMQFLLGGLFSAYVIFYFQSSSFTKASLFLVLLVFLLVANEFLEKRLSNFNLLIGLYFLASFSFFIFFVPVVLKRHGLLTFLFGGFLSLLLVAGLIYYCDRKSLFSSRNKFFQAGSLVLSLYALINIFYWLNWIPPVPLSLKSGGIYHHASKNSDNRFKLKFEQPKWYEIFKDSDDVYHYSNGDTISCFTAVFAPTKLQKKIVHHWQQFVDKQNKWLTTDRLDFNIIGFRDGGYRGITRKRNVTEGKWRVDVETADGLLLGRIKFDIKNSPARMRLKTIYK